MSALTYEFPEKLLIGPELTASLMACTDAIGRLDERARTSPLRDGWMARLLFDEACANELAQGTLVHREDLVLFDAGASEEGAFLGLQSAAQVLQVWRAAWAGDAAALLRLERPGDESAARLAVHEVGKARRSWVPEYFFDPDWNGAERLKQWRRVLSGSRALPPLLAAAVVWDAWLVLEPEQRGSWRAGLLAALVLRSRGATRHFLLPVDTGGRFAKYRRHPAHDFQTRMAGFVEWAGSAAEHGSKDLDRLVVASDILGLCLKGRRKTSRLPALVALLMSRPVVSIGMAAKALKCSPQAVEKMMRQLGSTPRELTGRTRNRVWGIV
jgi:hypothetical protein